LNNAQNVAFLFWSYFDYVMLTYERYQALRVIHIRVQGEPGNEATKTAQGSIPRGIRDQELEGITSLCWWDVRMRKYLIAKRKYKPLIRYHP